MKKLLLGSAALAVLAATARQPGRGSQTTRAAPEWIITFATGGGVSTNPSYPTDPGPYDGSDDTYIGAINNSSSAISSFRFGARLLLGRLRRRYGGPNASTGLTSLLSGLTPLSTAMDAIWHQSR
jgi:hypothetical protein